MLEFAKLRDVMALKRVKYGGLRSNSNTADRSIEWIALKLMASHGSRMWVLSTTVLLTTTLFQFHCIWSARKWKLRRFTHRTAWSWWTREHFWESAGIIRNIHRTRTTNVNQSKVCRRVLIWSRLSNHQRITNRRSLAIEDIYTPLLSVKVQFLEEQSELRKYLFFSFLVILVDSRLLLRDNVYHLITIGDSKDSLKW